MSAQEDKLERPYTLGTIDRFEGSHAIVTWDDQSFTVPKEKLPANTTEGSAVRIIISNDQSETQERELRAKTILNELLSGDKTT